MIILYLQFFNIFFLFCVLLFDSNLIFHKGKNIKKKVHSIQSLKSLLYNREVSSTFTSRNTFSFPFPKKKNTRSFTRNSFLLRVFAEMAVNGLCTSTDDFLKQCEQSGDAAYGMLRSLLERLEDPVTRKEARIFLTLLQKRFATKEASDQCLQSYHFQIQDIVLEHYEGPCSFSPFIISFLFCVFF